MTRASSGYALAMASHAPRRVEVSFDVGVPPLEPPASFLDDCAAQGIVFDEGDLERLGRYLALLLEANKSFNLTRVDTPEEAWRKHIFDSLTLLPLLAECPAGARLADVGSGGGLPGVPLAICMPGLRVSLIEATGKKAEFLRIAVREIGLANVEIVNDRAETVGQDAAHRACYDAVVARAVGRLSVIAELTVPLARDPDADGEPGRVILIKGAQASVEVDEGKAALHLLHAATAGIVETPTGRLVVLEKLRPTPRAYPRKSGEPKRAPLGC